MHFIQACSSTSGYRHCSSVNELLLSQLAMRSVLATSENLPIASLLPNSLAPSHHPFGQNQKFKVGTYVVTFSVENRLLDSIRPMPPMYNRDCKSELYG